MLNNSLFCKRKKPFVIALRSGSIQNNVDAGEYRKYHIWFMISS